jgi:hypothetical protein
LVIYLLQEWDDAVFFLELLMRLLMHVDAFDTSRFCLLLKPISLLLPACLPS